MGLRPKSPASACGDKTRSSDRTHFACPSKTRAKHILDIDGIAVGALIGRLHDAAGGVDGNA